MEQFNLCSHFHCTPRQLEEEFYPQEAVNFSKILQAVHEKQEAANRRSEQQSAAQPRFR